MLHVEVVAFATLRQYMPDVKLGSSRMVAVEPGTTIADLLHLIGFPEEEVRVVVRNHLQADLSDVVNDGDRVAFIPAVAGG